MSINSSSSNVSLLPPFLLLSNTSNHHATFECFDSRLGSLIITAFTITDILLLLPVSILVLYLGFQRWRRQCCVSAATTMSHSDVFTYHMVTMELTVIIGSVLYCCGTYTADFRIMMAGFCIFSIASPGQVLFHCLTCIERYLAVVHPITYLSLRKARGIRLRNISIGFVWLLSFGWVGIMFLYSPSYPTISRFFLLALFLVLTSFCSLSVLCTLIRPRPGEAGGNRERVDQSKLRAFYTIMAIMGVLLMRIVGLLVCFGVSSSGLIGSGDNCVVVSSAFWFSLPSSLVLPLLFLHRAGKVVCCKHNAESG